MFRDVTFEKELNLRDTLFNKNVNFLNIRKNKKNQIVSVSNRETARIIKDSFEQQNNIIEANKFYSLEMEQRNNELKLFSKDFFQKSIFSFHDWSSNHSQEWTLALFWIIQITFFYSNFIHHIKDFFTLNSLVLGLGSILGLVVIGCTIFKAPEPKKNRWKFTISISFVMYVLYGYLNDDYKLTNLSSNFNPFSMASSSTITFGELLYKIVIGYLIYQLIISIRQNTRRK